MVVLSVLCAALVVAVAVLAFNVWYLHDAAERHFQRLEANYVDGLKVNSRLRRLEREGDDLWLEVEALYTGIEDKIEEVEEARIKINNLRRRVADLETAKHELGLKVEKFDA